MHYPPLQMAGEQGAADALEFAISCLPKKKQKDKRVMEDVLKAVFTNSCYECINGMGPKCVRGIHETTPHPKNASHTRCIDAVLATGYKPSRQYIKEIKNMMIDTKVGLLQYLMACTETEIDSRKAGQKPAAEKTFCKVCKKGDMN